MFAQCSGGPAVLDLTDGVHDTQPGPARPHAHGRHRHTALPADARSSLTRTTAPPATSPRAQ